MEIIRQEFQSIQNNNIYNGIAKNSKILFTGMTGPFGIWTVRYVYWTLTKAGVYPKIFILTRNLKKAKEIFQEFNDFKYINSDIRKEIPEENFDYIIHAAAPSASETFQGMQAIEKCISIIEGTRNILSLCKINPPKKLIFISSGAVYGAQNGKISEKSQRAPSTIVAVTGLAQGKRAAEYLISSFCQENMINYGIFRCFSFSGFGIPLNLHYALGNFIRDAMDGKDIVVEGSGRDLRSYLHLGDLSWIITHSLFTATDHTLYNVGGIQPISIYELAEKVRCLINNKIKIVIKNKNNRIGNETISSYIPNTKRLLKDFKFVPKTLDYSIRTMTGEI